MVAMLRAEDTPEEVLGRMRQVLHLLWSVPSGRGFENLRAAMRGKPGSPLPAWGPLAQALELLLASGLVRYDGVRCQWRLAA